MPANEDTSNESLERIEPGRISPSLSQRKMSGGLQNLASSLLPGATVDDDLESSRVEERNFRSIPRRDIHEKLFRDFFELVLQQAVFQSTSGKERVVEWMNPSDLRSVVDFSLPAEGVSHEELLALTRNVIKYSVKTGHPHFVNQLFSSLDPYGLLGQWLTDALNPSVYTYEVSPVFSLMEEDVLREMRRIIGWKGGEGLFCPGGSMANGYAINLARHHRYPNMKQTGLSQMPRLVIFTSEDAHYSVKKLAAFLGIGYDNVYSVKVDSRGKMLVSDLEAQIARATREGAVPLMVSSTAGTTVLGAFDPLKDIAEVCRKHRLWFHVDAAWGGGALVSRTYRRLLDGVELADSITWNPHKLLAAPQQCSTLLLRHEGLLQSAHGCGASYLFQNDKFYDSSYDCGDRHVQCGRRADVVKFWYMWKAKGTRGLEEHVDHVFALSRYFADLVRTRDGWHLLAEPECTNVCFRYIPPSMRDLAGRQLDQAIHKVAPMIKERMVRAGTMLMTYQPLRGTPNFFRLVLQNSGLSEIDMQFFVEEIERLAADL
ncbi:cysteine sulfinic acid decarboxylase [Harpegnathos saltator]|uniref:Glutamate decarboxylase-like protein 1 n=1 Tax=Harpegnathos saltator TaxID=610380 RepID=E2B481_HARSA|nr:cysteine sulfinic acid decarboxylase [Harpegnathos saltator]EFN89498.1 Glutamate decarboxylase-like protein 1 [Harpegnathos saltator]